jgi:hypothetical protein
MICLLEQASCEHVNRETMLLMSCLFLGRVIYFDAVALIFNCFNMFESLDKSLNHSGTILPSLQAVDTGSLWTVISKIDSNSMFHILYILHPGAIKLLFSRLGSEGMSVSNSQMGCDVTLILLIC